MQTQRTFIKKTRRGNIVKVVREHYLRDDILCGWEQDQENCCLDKKPISKSRWVLPDPSNKTHDIIII